MLKYSAVIEPVIKIDLNERLNGPEPVVVELGCGIIKPTGRIGIDKVDMPCVDIVADIEQGLPFLPDNSVDEVHCSHFLEHVTDLRSVMREIVRILKKDGKAHILVPHFSNPHYYSDYTHTRFFGLYSFYYFVDRDHQSVRRKVPDFYSDIRIEVLSLRLIFKSAYKIPGTSRKVARPLKAFYEWFFNLSSLMQEFYEENLCYIFPCKAIEVVFAPRSRETK